MTHARRTTTILSRSPRDTGAVARGLARTALPGLTVALIGGLGAGKTVFTRAFARALGVRFAVTSPTFIIVSAHQVSRRSITTLYHVDCYRLAGVRGDNLRLIRDAVSDPRGVCLIEWADKIKNLSRSLHVKKLTVVRFRVTGPRTRALSIEGRLARALH